MSIPSSELILNPDGSIYHLNLLPEDIAQTIITVGDPERVDQVTKHFDSIELSKERREFKTVTGVLNKKRITVLSTGIGTDNIDIVLNELDALANIDLEHGIIKEEHTALDIIRIGTSGAIQPEIEVDSFILSEKAIGLDALLHFYDSYHIQDVEMQKAFVQHMQWSPQKSEPYIISCDQTLSSLFESEQIQKGITATNIGFYGPQGRVLRLQTSDMNMNNNLAQFRFREKVITNLEMETSGIYGLSKLLGHRGVSLNAILANRATGKFSTNPSKVVERLITYALDRIAFS